MKNSTIFSLTILCIVFGCSESDSTSSPEGASSATFTDSSESKASDSSASDKDWDTEWDKEYDKDDKEYICDNSKASGYKTVVQGSATREYILTVPESYDANNATSLIINYHGFGGCAQHFQEEVGESYGMDALADSENVIVAYPQAIVGEKGDAYWDPGDNGTEDITESDIYFTEQLIANIAKEYTVDLSRVYATGYSNGGMMSYGLACSRGDLIAAIGIMSGTMLEDACTTDATTSVIVFHGIADYVLPYAGNQNYKSTSDAVNIWLDHNSIPAESRITTKLNNGAVTRDVYSGGAENTSVVLYTIHSEYGKDGGHVWFSADIDGMSPNQIVWEFLSAH
ncbi:MAG: alpha/beta hydrolase-fold protein [Fibrobacterales bacterium]